MADPPPRRVSRTFIFITVFVLVNMLSWGIWHRSTNLNAGIDRIEPNCTRLTSHCNCNCSKYAKMDCVSQSREAVNRTTPQASPSPIQPSCTPVVLPCQQKCNFSSTLSTCKSDNPVVIELSASRKRQWPNSLTDGVECKTHKSLKDICNSQDGKQPIHVLSPWPSPVQFDKWPVQKFWHPSLRRVMLYNLDQEPLIELVHIRRTDNRISVISAPRMLSKEARENACDKLEEFRIHLCHDVLIPEYGGGDRFCGADEMIVKTSCPAYITTYGEVPGTVFDSERYFQTEAPIRPPDACENETAEKHHVMANSLASYPDTPGHFPLQIMPRILLFMDFLADVKILAPLSGIAAKYLNHLIDNGKLNQSRLIPYEPSKIYEADAVYLPVFTTFYSEDSCGATAYGRFRQYYDLSWPSSRSDIVVVKRYGARAVVNHDQLIEALTAADVGTVKVFEPASTLAEDIAFFSSAYLMIAPHGAGMSNMVWLKPGTNVIELAYDDAGQMPMPRMFYDVSVQIGLVYWLSVASGTYGGALTVNIGEIIEIAKIGTWKCV